MSLNKKGFTLIESLFAFSIFTTVIILLVSLYVTNSKTNIKVNQEYKTYQSEKQQIEYTLNLDEGIETCLKRLYISRSIIEFIYHITYCFKLFITSESFKNF